MDCDGDRTQSYIQSFVNDENDIEKYGDLWFQIAEKYLAAHNQFGEEHDRTQFLEHSLFITTKLMTSTSWSHLLVLLR